MRYRHKFCMLNHFACYEDIKYYVKDGNRPLTIEMNMKVLELRKDELGEKIMTDSIALRPDTYSYWRDDYTEKGRTMNENVCYKEKT